LTPQELQGVVSDLHQLAGGSAPSEELPYVSIDGYEHINGELLATVEKITQAMQRNVAVVFSYCDYDEHGDLVKRLQHRKGEHQGEHQSETGQDNKPRRYLLDPYNMVYKKGRYYLLGHYHDNPVPEGIEQDEKSTNLSCFTVDRIRNLQITTMPIAVPASTWDENGLPRN
jgi:predicted DNA-binding transcriptional regulator YafY